MSDTTPEPTPLPAHLRGAEESIGAAQLDALFAGIASETVDRPANLRDRARELPTSTRVSIAVAGTLALMVAYTLAVGVRGDLDTAGWMQFGATSLALTAFSVACAALTLRGLHQSPLHETTWKVGVAAVLLPAIVSLVPGLIPGVLLDHPPMSAHLACGLGGLLAGVVSAVALLFFSREDVVDPWRILTVSGAGGMLGFVAQGAHCAMINLPHLLFAHALYGVVIWGILTVAMARR